MKKKIIQLIETDSTNRYIKELAPQSEEMVVVTTEWQSAGKGQGKNSWESEKGKNLLFSLLIHPTFVKVEHQFLLSMVGALSLQKTLQHYTQEITIKWPNDIYWRDKKISGTLIETRLAQGVIKDAIIGIGVNINQTYFKSDAPNPISLYQIMGSEVNQHAVMESFLQHFEAYYQLLSAGQEDTIIKEYHKNLYREKGYYLYEDAKGMFEAQLVRVKENGTLVLQDKEGATRYYTLKEVAFIL